MTQEEKAKAYDEIIKKANKMHHENCEACQMCIEELIPELKESKDERIRKHLISLFENFVILGVANECETSEIKVDDILAWLEKQDSYK